MEDIENVEVPQPGVAFIVINSNSLARVTKILKAYGPEFKIQCVGVKKPFEAHVVHFECPTECIDFYISFVEATASRAVLRQIARIERIADRVRLQKKHAKVIARRNRVGSEVVDSE